MAKVSVVVPVYNAEKHLDRCIKSILGQSFADLELIIVNDGSTDGSLKKCEKYAIKDKRLVIIDQKNEGCIAARRRGIEATTSNYVMFVDADDWINKKTIETLYNEMMENDVDVTVCNIFRFFGRTSLVKKKNESEYFNKEKIYVKESIKNDLIVAYLYGHPFPASLYAKLYKRDLLVNSGKYLNQITFFGEDLYFNIEILLKANKVKVIDKALYYYRAGGNTSKYMPYLFKDMVNGYTIQKGIIDDYYQNTKYANYNGISIMLLNTLKTCLRNLFISSLRSEEIKEVIRSYIENENVIESAKNNGAIKYFPSEYLLAIHNKDINYLYELGKSFYKKRKPKDFIVKFISVIS